MNQLSSPITAEIIRQLPNKRAALKACALYSGKALKAIAYEIGINDPGHLSKMLNDHADPRHFPPEKENMFMDVCGNEIPLFWALMSRGYELPSTLEDLRRENEKLRAENEQLKAEALALRSETRVVVGNIFKTVQVS